MAVRQWEMVRDDKYPVHGSKIAMEHSCYNGNRLSGRILLQNLGVKDNAVFDTKSLTPVYK